ncbi:MAG: HAD-IIB family hydrolase [Gammaproteobacteria bacterium]|nr:HAD-IIB family hydrolase [Gammaproteobacteria bacterium]
MRLLLCTDLDRTLLPNGPQPESAAAREGFSRLVSQPGVVLVFVTGRDKARVQQAITNYQLPDPDYVIADVGSSLYRLDNSEWHHVLQWDEMIGQDWQGKSRADLQDLFLGLDGLRLQELSKQNTHKLSYYVPLYTDHHKLMEKMKDRLQHTNIQASFIWSVDELANTGLLDILPASAGKRHAIEFLMRQLDFSQQQTVFAGDSGNDIAVMASPVQSVLVANATDDVRQQVMQHAKLNHQLETVYIARGDFFGMNGNYSAGILEGVAHYMPEAVGWLNPGDHE